MTAHAGTTTPSPPISSHFLPLVPSASIGGRRREINQECVDLDLFGVLDDLTDEGMTVSLADGVTPALRLDPRPSPALFVGVLRHRVWLGVVVRGRHDGFAPSSCDACGFVSMIAVVTSSGTSRWAPSVGWPRCPLTGCRGRRIIREADRVAVARIKYRAPRRQGTNHA